MWKRLLVWFFFILAVLGVRSALSAGDAAPHSYAEAVKQAKQAVVNIYTDRALLRPPSFFNNNPRFLSTPPQAVTLGSGVIVDRRGTLLTNYHVVRNARHILVACDDGRKAVAKVLGYDQATDLAVLRMTLPKLHPVSWGNSDRLQVGDVVLAMGNPFGLGQTVTQGIVSAMGRSALGINPLESYIQTDAAINPGSSGGALVDVTGALVGINTAIYSRSGGYQGVGFAIPVSVVRNVVQQIIQFGAVKRGWLGVTVNDDRAGQFGHSTGVLVVSVLPGSPAAKAGMQANDRITHINQHRIHSVQGFLHDIAQRQPGATLALTLKRQQETHQLSVQIDQRPE